MEKQKLEDWEKKYYTLVSPLNICVYEDNDDGDEEATGEVSVCIDDINGKSLDFDQTGDCTGGGQYNMNLGQDPGKFPWNSMSLPNSEVELIPPLQIEFGLDEGLQFVTIINGNGIVYDFDKNGVLICMQDEEDIYTTVPKDYNPNYNEGDTEPFLIKINWSAS